jgi:hypothetical protein
MNAKFFAGCLMLATIGCGGPATAPVSTAQQSLCTSNCCYGASCDNLDPFEHHCNITSLQAIDIPCNGTCSGSAATLVNYYSAGCNANWTYLYGGNPAGRPFLIDIDTTYERATGVKVHVHYCYPEDCSSYYTGTAYPLWTNMVNGDEVTTSCAHTDNGGGSSGDCVSQ